MTAGEAIEINGVGADSVNAAGDVSVMGEPPATPMVLTATMLWGQSLAQNLAGKIVPVVFSAVKASYW